MALRVIDETSLTAFGLCSMSTGLELYPSPDVWECVAEQTACWLMAEHFNGNTPNAYDVVVEAERRWRRYEPERQLATSEVRMIPGIGLRLRRLMSRCEVITPEVGYQLSFGRSRIEGTYQLLRDVRRPQVAMVPVFHVHRVNVSATGKPLVIPDLVTLARWLHAADNSGFERTVVYHYWPTSDRVSYIEEFDYQKAHSVLRGVVQAIESGVQFPSPGPHCDSCKSYGCLSVRRKA